MKYHPAFGFHCGYWRLTEDNPYDLVAITDSAFMQTGCVRRVLQPGECKLRMFPEVVDNAGWFGGVMLKQLVATVV